MVVLNIFERLYYKSKYPDFTVEQVSEMANIKPSTTGLPMYIYVSDGSGFVHGPRIKVSKLYGKMSKSDLFTVTIENNPKIIGSVGDISKQDIIKVKDFVIRNKDLLLKYWNSVIDTEDLINSLK